MRTILRSNIIIPDRVRKVDEAHAKELADDIALNGLLQPAVIKSPSDPQLVIGGHRLRAIEILAERGVSHYRYDGHEIRTNLMATLAVGDLPADELLRMEIAENAVRLAVDWQDHTRAIARLHEMVAQRKPEATVTDTARELQSMGDTRHVTTVHREVARAIAVAEHMDDPEVANAKSMGEAFTLVRKRTIEEGRRAKAKLMELMPVRSRHTLIKGDFRHHADAVRNVDLILSDPPYGIGADGWNSKFRNTPHQYDDSWNAARDVIFPILDHGFREWTKPLANLFMFCSPELWHDVRDLAEQAGWTTWPRPIIWKKSNEGIRPWGITGFAYTYEAILYATKGQKGLMRSVADVIDVYKVSNFSRLHGAQKPTELYQRLIELCCNPGDVVYDPTCGSGTIFEACELTKTTAVGCEMNPDLWPMIESRISELGATPAAKDDMDDLFPEPAA